MESIRFLDLIGGHQAVRHFQTFSDKKKGSASTPRGKFDEVMQDTLAVINKHGGGIFVAINLHNPRGDRLKKNACQVNALFVDFDDDLTAHDKMLAAIKVLPATMVVESSPDKYHVYWSLSNPGSISPINFSAWQKVLSSMFGSDTSINDVSRVMRVPGFLHQKKEPFRTHIIDKHSTGIKYTVDELVSAFYGGRNKWLTVVAGSLRRKNMNAEEIYGELMTSNLTLDIPLDENEVMLISHSVQRYEHGMDSKEMCVANLNLDVSKGGAIISSYQNTLKIVQFEKCMQYNSMLSNVEVCLPVPWGDRAPQNAVWTDTDTIRFLSYLVFKYKCEFNRMNLDMAINQVADLNRYDPLVNYLSALVWDGTPRVATSLHRHLHVGDTSYTRAVSESLFVGAVRRAFEPGCKHDYMIVIMGEEGSGKSKFCASIAKHQEFFSDSLGDLRNKDSVIGLQGKWIVEFGELRSLQGAGAEHTKAFISTQVDNIRLPFGKRTQPFPRRCVFIGTTNNHTFITDTGTNRRMLPVHTPLSEERGQVMDHRALDAEVDQLWAEAVQMYNKGARGLVDHALMPEAMDRRLEHTEDGGYVRDIMAYMMDETGVKVNGHPMRRELFIPRDFYLATVDGSSKERWTNENKLHKQIVNSARKVFCLPEWSNYTEGRYRVGGAIVKCWKILDRTEST